MAGLSISGEYGLYALSAGGLSARLATRLNTQVWAGAAAPATTHISAVTKNPKTNLQTAVKPPFSRHQPPRSQSTSAKMADSVTLRTRKFQRNPLLARVRHSPLVVDLLVWLC